MNEAKSRGHARRLFSFVLVPLLLLLLAALLSVSTGAAFAGLSTSNPSGLSAQSNVPAQGTATRTATASPTVACLFGWTTYPNPAPQGESTLSAINALGPNDIWAVGSYGSTPLHTLTVHWNGTVWIQVPSPSPGYTELLGVAGVGPNDVWAVGRSNSGSGFVTLTEHWDGTAWTVVPSPNPSGGSYNVLDGVAAISSNDVWAVGTYNMFVTHTLTEHWDGTSWTIVPTPTGATSLFSVAAVSSNDVWAVGTAAEHWDGSSWTIVPIPYPSSDTYLFSVAAVSSNDVWAVGYCCSYPGPYQTVVLHWDGSSWTRVPSPNPGATNNSLRGVSARASNDVWAVGYTDQASGGLKTLAEHWDGTAWTVVPTFNSPAGTDRFNAVTVAAGGVVWAVGNSGCTSGCTQEALIARYAPACTTPTPTPVSCGLDWRVVVSPPGDEAYLKALSILSADDIWAVGTVYTNLDNGRVPDAYAHTLTEHWDGTQWSVVPSPNPYVDFLYGVAAVAHNDVWAVGDDDAALIEHWDGTQWSVVSNPGGVSCPTPAGTARS